MVSVLHSGQHGQWANSKEFAESGIVLSGYRPAARQPLIQLAKLAQTEGTLQVAESIVVSQVHHLIEPRAHSLALAVITSDAMIAEAAQFLGEPRVVGSHHSTFCGGDVFDGMKAKGGQGAEAAH